MSNFVLLLMIKLDSFKMAKYRKMKNTISGSVSSTVDNGIMRLSFYHPSHNSMPSNLLNDLVNKIEEGGKSPETKVIILQSEGNRTFCAGANFDELLAIDDFESGKQFFSGFANVINAMRRCPKLIIGRVQGKAIGGGVGLAAATDYCFATQFASIKLSELSLGIGPFVVGPAVERKIGLTAFSEMTINATEWKSAKWAKEKGLFAATFDSAEEMDVEIGNLASKLAQSSPEAMKQLKKIFWEGTENWEQLLMDRAAISGQLVLSSFAKNALRKFS